MEHLGDITQLKGNEIPKVDIICGGSPCQNLSVAGKREGLAGEQSGLFMEQIRLIKEMREDDRADGRTAINIRPRYMVWENVPGAFSSNKGEDFRCVLEETAKIADSNATIPRLKEDRNGKQKWSKAGAILGDGWSIAWRVHDAQFWGVPQRRKRIALVADFAGTTALEILFKPKSLYGNITESREEGQGTTTDAERSVGETSEPILLESHPADSRVKIREDGTVQTLSSRMGTGGGNVPMVMESKANGFNGWQSTTSSMPIIDNGTPPIEATMPPYVFEPGAASRVGGHVYENKAGSLRAKAGDNQQAVVVQGVERTDIVYCVGNGQLQQTKLSDKAGALNCMHDQQALLTYGLDRASFNQGMNAKYNFSVEEEKIGAQVAKGPGAVCNNYIVRRLTPLECERLQGYPDGWTDIGEWQDSRGKKHKDADSPRYKALGNSIALPFWEWMAKRMVKHINHEATMGSLFDGIGGFPLVFSRAGAKPIWASEIEEFPIAVTKLRFKE